MDWFDYAYPNSIYIVEVKYSGDIAIAYCRCNEEPQEKDNSRGFTANFRTYEAAVRYARQVAKELNIKAGF